MKTKTGTVTSAKMDKTVVILVNTYKSHPKYKKKYLTSKKFYAHDENNVCREGDTVTFEEGRPMSKTKRWRLITVNGQPVESVTPEPLTKPVTEELEEENSEENEVIKETPDTEESAETEDESKLEDNSSEE